MSRVRRVSFVVRVIQRRRGEVSGVIEQVATGAKEAFSSIEAIGPGILGLLQREGPVSKASGVRKTLTLRSGKEI